MKQALPRFRRAVLKDAQACTAIYNPYIQSIISFEETPIDAAEMQSRMQACLHTFPWWIVEVQGEVLGYAYASAWKQRAAYQYSVESSIYLAPQAQGKGLGKALYENKFPCQKIWCWHQKDDVDLNEFSTAKLRDC